MKTAKEILMAKATEYEDGFLTGQPKWIIEAMEEYAKAYHENEVNKCPDCNGEGWTAEHDPNDPHEWGKCYNCPIQVQCERCQGTGKIIIEQL